MPMNISMKRRNTGIDMCTMSIISTSMVLNGTRRNRIAMCMCTARCGIVMRIFRMCIIGIGTEEQHLTGSPSTQIGLIQQDSIRMKIVFIASLGFLSLVQTSPSVADSVNGKNIYLQRCAMCHGADLKATGPLANKSNPPTPNLTTAAFKKRLNDYPGVIVSSIILRPNGDLIPRTLRENGVKLAPFDWRVKDFRDLNEYMSGVISKNR